MQQEQRDWVRLVCARTGMPAAAQQKLETAARTAFSPKVWQAAEGLTDPDRAQQSWECLKSLLAPDPDGWKMLFVQLSRTRETAQRLARSGFTEEEIWSTLEAFSRFVREREATGFLDFDRDFWTWRQTSGRVVRLGCLEYEPLDDCVMLHIPSDAQLTEEEVDASLTRAKKRWGTRAFYCDSWLLAPALDELLPTQSRIRSFRAAFSTAARSSAVRGAQSARAAVFSSTWERVDMPLSTICTFSSPAAKRSAHTALLHSG